MATATTLAQAAGQCADNMGVWWNISQLKVRLQAFAGPLFDFFPDTDANARPVADWLTVLVCAVDPMPNNLTITQYTDTTQIMYRLLWMASFLQTSSLITSSQAAQVLGSYNANIGF
jgi:hypothetical protein